MLAFNPVFRPSAKELLQSKIFDNIRNKTNEADATKRINIDIDMNEHQATYINDHDVSSPSSPIMKLKRTNGKSLQRPKSLDSNNKMKPSELI